MKSETSFRIADYGIARVINEVSRSLISSDFVQKVAETFTTRLLLIGIGIAASVIITRILGPEGRGFYAVASSIGAIGVQFGNLGQHASNIYSVAKNRSLLPVLIGNSLLVGVAFGGLISGVAWALFSFLPDIAPLRGTLLMLGLSWIPLGLSYMLLQNLLLGIQEIRAYNKIELAGSMLGVAFTALLVSVGLVTVEAVFSVGLVVLVINIVWILKRLRAHFKGPVKPSLELLRKTMSYGFKAYLAAFFAFLVLRIDVLMVKYLLGPEHTGYYSVAVGMADLLYMLPVVIGNILFPRLAAMPTDEEKWSYTTKTFAGVAVVMMLLIALGFLFAGPMVRLLYGTGFLASVPAFLWLLPGIFMLSLNSVFMSYFAATGMPSITVYSPFIAAIVNILLNLKLIPSLGISGASISSVIAYGLMLGMSLIYTGSKRDTRTKCN